MAESLPYGLRDTKVTPYSDSTLTALGAPVDYPNARTLSFTEAEDFEELRGDDRVIAIRGKGPSIEWEMEHGGITLECWKTMAGGTIVTAGSGSTLVTTFTKTETDSRPYFHAEGQSISDNGGDFHARLPRCRASDSLEGELADGTFWLSKASGTALGSKITGEEGTLYEFIINATATDIEES
jgi:hypothetical protein